MLDLQEKMQKLSTTTIELFYCDEQQNVYNRLVIEMECHAEKYNEDFVDGKLRNIIIKLVSNEEGWLRLLQSVIELTGTALEDDTIFNMYYWLFCDLPQSNFPSPSKILELLNPYIQTRAQCACSDLTIKQRNVCIALQIMLSRVDKGYKVELMSKEIISFLSRILNECSSKPNLLCALSCLSAFLLNNQIRDVIKNSKEGDIIASLRKMRYYLDSYTLQIFYISKFDYTRFQIGFLARWFLDTINGHAIGTSSDTESKSSLNPTDCTLNIKLSPDQLSVRSVGILDRIRAAYPITCGLFYYEVILLTSGSFSIGWTTKQSDIHDPLENYSILFNGYENRIIREKTFDTTKKSSQAGDVVGCMIDMPNKKFAFYLNCQLVNNQLSVPFSTDPYFAVICVTAFQHCYCNFGQVPFKHPPSVTYRTFHGSISKYINDKLCPFCNLKPTGARFANCDHWKVCSECLVKLEKCPTCNE